MKKSLFYLLLLFTVVVFSQNEKVETPKIALKIPMGEMVAVHGASIKFIQVLEDSRCPTNVTCVWAGRAIIDLEVTYKGKTEKKEIVFNPAISESEKNMEIIKTEEFSILAYQLNPYPDMDDTVPLAYVLLVLETKQ